MIAGTQAEYQSDAEYTKDTPYLALMGELWDVFCEYFVKKIDRIITAPHCTRFYSLSNGHQVEMPALNMKHRTDCHYWQFPSDSCGPFMIRVLYSCWYWMNDWIMWMQGCINILKLGQSSRCFAHIFKCILFNQNDCIWIKISLKIVPKVLIDNKSTMIRKIFRMTRLKELLWLTVQIWIVGEF